LLKGCGGRIGIIIRRIINPEEKKDKNARVSAATAGIILMVNRQILRESVNCVSVKGVRLSLEKFSFEAV